MSACTALLPLTMLIVATLWLTPGAAAAQPSAPDASGQAEPQNAPQQQQPADAQPLLYVGTYTRGKSEGIYRFRMDPASGELTPAGVTGGIKNPSFLALHPSGRFLYSVAEVSDVGQNNYGAVSAFAVDPATGELTKLNDQPSEGAGPCFVTVDATGKNALVANYGGGSVAVLPIQEDGRLAPASSAIQHEGSSVNPQRQAGPHAHSINIDATNQYAFAADLGLDKILIYRFDPEQGKLSPADPPFASVAAGAGPRHFSFHPSGRYAYVINELASTVTTFTYDAQRGTLQPLQSLSTLPEGFDGNNSTAEVLVHPSGQFLYGSNRGHNSIAIFSIDPQSGKLTAAGHSSSGGQTPRNFRIDPTGRFLLAANQQSDNIVVFRIDQQTGQLEPTGHEVSVPMPVCIKFR